MSGLPLRRGPIAREIQGNVLAPFNKPRVRFVLVELPDGDVAAAKRWLRATLPLVCNSEEVADHNDARRQDPTLTALWTTLGLTCSGLERLGMPTAGAELARHRSFRVGAAERAKELGDVDDSAPPNWLFGTPEVPVDAVLTVAGDKPGEVSERADAVKQSAIAHGARVRFAPLGRRLDGGREHFGFRDGIGQPQVKGFDPTGIQPGEFLLGWPREGRDPEEPPTWLRNASFQVLRVLEQDVAKWRDAADGEDPERWAADRVGRTQDGDELDPMSPASHIRKAVPTDVASMPERHRLLRRGIPYGPPFSAHSHASRGLLFNAFMANIGTQYEYVQAFFANAADFPTRGSGPDPVIGGPDARFALYGKNQPTAHAWPRFVTTRAAVYAIALSLPALRDLAG